MNILSIPIFFVIMYGLGYSLTRFLKTSFESVHLIRLACGLSALPLLGLILNTLHIPLHWYLVLLISQIFPVLDVFTRKLTFPCPKIKIKTGHILLILLVILLCIIYLWGAFVFPWPENDDSWDHAGSVSYVLNERNLNAPSGIFSYFNPYPPGYAFVLGIPAQINDSLLWTLKFFNSLFVILGYLFFFNFVRFWTAHKTKSLWALFILICTPCYLSHFIWAHALCVSLFFPAFHFALKSLKEKKFILPASIAVSGILLTQQSQAIKFLIMYLILGFIFMCIRRKFPLRMLYIGLIGGMLSLLWWGPIALQLSTGKLQYNTQHYDYDITTKTGTTHFISKVFSQKGGSASRAYSWKDYFFAPPYNMINNPLGLGPMLCILLILGIGVLFLKIPKAQEEEKVYIWTIFGWLLFTIVGMNSVTFNLPAGLFAFRFWMLFAFIQAVIVAEIMYIFFHEHTKTIRNILICGTILIGIGSGSLYPKIKINTAIWPWGIYWNSKEELKGYLWMRQALPAKTKVFAFTENRFVLGVDMFADYWSDKYKTMAEGLFHQDLGGLYEGLKRNGYHFLVVDQRTAKKFGFKETEAKLEDLAQNPYFELKHQEKGAFWLFRLKDPKEIKPITLDDQFRL